MTRLKGPSGAKATLRAELKRMRAALTAEEWARRSLAIVAHVERYLETIPASKVALYSPIEVRREVDVSPLDGWLRARGSSVAYPRMQGAIAGFAWVHAPSALLAHSLFSQPDPTLPGVAPGELDVIVVPALAATLEGYRLGYGSGFYDRALSSFCPPATSLCVVFESQIAPQLPIAAHDIACDVVITERGVVRCPQTWSTR